MHSPTTAQLATYLDHTQLSPVATSADIEALCAEAIRLGVKAVCVNPHRLPLVVQLLRGQIPVPITVCGFPLGASTTSAKAYEAGLAVEQGAVEVDMVLNIGALKDGDTDGVRLDISEVVRACGAAPVKVILETCLLTDAEKELACRLAVEAGASFVKTSTGFSTAGATEADIRLMRRVVGPQIGVKASGGIRTRADALRMIAAGANRIGASASRQILGDNQ